MGELLHCLCGFSSAFLVLASNVSRPANPKAINLRRSKDHYWNRRAGNEAPPSEAFHIRFIFQLFFSKALEGLYVITRHTVDVMSPHRPQVAHFVCSRSCTRRVVHLIF